MNKTHIYTFLSLLFAVVFIFASMFGMNAILRFRERQLLTGRGETMAESPVRAWLEPENEEITNDGVQDAGRELTLSQIEDAVDSWNRRIRVMLHDPVEGQISMEQAITAGTTWIKEMGILGDEGENDAIYSVYAALGVSEQDGLRQTQMDLYPSAAVGVSEQDELRQTQAEPYHSFWTVELSIDGMKAVLNVNAVTGKVWGATITLRGDVWEIPSYGTIERFWELAGLPMDESNTELTTVNDRATQVIYVMEGSSLYAWMQYSPVTRSNQMELTDHDYFYMVMTEEVVVINYRLRLRDA